MSLEGARVYWAASQFVYPADRQNRTSTATAKSNGLYLLAYMPVGVLVLGFWAIKRRQSRLWGWLEKYSEPNPLIFLLDKKGMGNQMKLILSKIVLVAVSMMYVGICAVAEPIAGGATPPVVDGDAALSGISKLILLDENDAKVYASNLQNLVGQYYQIVPTPNGGHALQLLGRASEDMKVENIELKDNKILFKKVTDSSYSAGITISWLNLKAKNGERLDTLIQDIATVSAPSTGQFISKHLPDKGAIDPTLPIYYVSGATVTLVSQKMYTTKNVEGAIAIFGGQEAYVKDIISNGWLVSVTKILAKRPTNISTIDINKSPRYMGISPMPSSKLYEDDSSVEGMIVSVRPSKNK